MTKNNIYELMQVPVIEVRFVNNVKESERIKITNSEDAAKLFRQIIDADTIDWQEQLAIIMLSRTKKVIGVRKVAAGGSNSTIIDPKIIFSLSLACMADGIIICHNHPMGGLVPSEADKKSTERLRKIGELHDIQLLDHIILTSEGFISFADAGLLGGRPLI